MAKAREISSLEQQLIKNWESVRQLIVLLQHLSGGQQVELGEIISDRESLQQEKVRLDLKIQDLKKKAESMSIEYKAKEKQLRDRLDTSEQSHWECCNQFCEVDRLCKANNPKSRSKEVPLNA